MPVIACGSLSPTPDASDSVTAPPPLSVTVPATCKSATPPRLALPCTAIVLWPNAASFTMEPASVSVSPDCTRTRASSVRLTGLAVPSSIA